MGNVAAQKDVIRKNLRSYVKRYLTENPLEGTDVSLLSNRQVSVIVSTFLETLEVEEEYETFDIREELEYFRQSDSPASTPKKLNECLNIIEAYTGLPGNSWKTVAKDDTSIYVALDSFVKYSDDPHSHYRYTIPTRIRGGYVQFAI